MSDPLAFRQDLMIDSSVIQIQQRLFSEVVAEFCRVTEYLPASQPASPKDSELLTDPCAELSKFGPDPNEDGEVIGDERRNIKGTKKHTCFDIRGFFEIANRKGVALA